jgi:hypothetical protein
MAFLCIQTTPKDCPLMSQALAMLLGEMEIVLREKRWQLFK